jgi:sec-independent protein translocase protein TatA
MGATSIWHWIILLLIVVLLFGRGKISEIMSDVAKGIKSFKKGMAEDESATKPEADRQSIEAKAAERASTENSKAN